MKENIKSMFNEFAPHMGNIAGGVHSMSNLNVKPNFNDVEYYDNGIFIFNNVFNDEDIEKIKAFFPMIGEYAPVSVQGMQSIDDIGIGSHRITGYLPNVADMINTQVSELCKGIILRADKYTSTDWHQGNLGNEWELVGITPMLRYMRYTKGGKHYPHYDAGYIYPSPYTHFRSLYSFVLYLTTNDSGATRFIADGQENVEISERNHDDWAREANEDEVLFKFLPLKGKMIAFPHRLCHDVEEFVDDNSERIIIRGDLLFKLKK